MMEVSGVSSGAFRITALVPEDMVSLPADGDWAAWFGLASTAVDGRRAVVLVSITVTAFSPPSAVASGESLAAMLRARYPEPGTRIAEFTTPADHPAAIMRTAAARQVNGRDVVTGQAQALVHYPEPRALGVVSGICLHPGDLDIAATLVTGIANGLTVTAAAAAA